MSNQEKPMSMEDLIKLASSPAGQQLMQMLRNSNPDAMHQAMQKAAAGDLDGAKDVISSFAQDPQVQKLLDQIGR